MATLIKRGHKYFVQIRRRGMATTCRSFHNRSDAEEWARYMEAKADRGDLPASTKELDKFTVRDVLERYRDKVVTDKKGFEVETYIINAFLRQPMASLTLAQVTSAHFSKYRDKRLREVQPVTVNRELGVIRHAFDTAMREWGIPLRENPLAKLRKLKVNNARSRRLEPHEYQAIMLASEKCRNPYFILLVRLALETAMRRGELINMEWRHIDFDARTVFIPVTKNGHSRTIPLTSEAITILQEVRNLQQPDFQFVFAGLTGNAADHAWGRLMKRANIDDLHFHDLRHEAISRFFERGLSVPEVALISGHRDYRMLFRYTHLKAEDVAQKLL